jgi:Mg2+-importing ATPase
MVINFLTDIPALTISSDNVDKEMLEKPRKWDVSLIKNS